MLFSMEFYTMNLLAYTRLWLSKLKVVIKVASVGGWIPMRWLFRSCCSALCISWLLLGLLCRIGSDPSMLLLQAACMKKHKNIVMRQQNSKSHVSWVPRVNSAESAQDTAQGWQCRWRLDGKTHYRSECPIDKF